MTTQLTLILLLLFTLSPLAQADQFTPESIQILVLKDGDRVARGGIHRAKLGETVTLYASVKGKLDGRRVHVCNWPRIEIDGRLIPAKGVLKPDQLSTFSDLALRWYKVQATGKSYDNTVGGFHWENIRYREYPLGAFSKEWSRLADAHPMGDYPDTHGGAGTMAYKVVLRLKDRLLASAGASSTFRGGLSSEVPRIAFRRDDTFIGRLTELFNTPYIWGSAGIPPKVHQAERLIGSDCADFMVYGARRLGKNLKYRASWHLPEVAKTIAHGDRVSEKGLFLGKKGKALTISESSIRIGDLLLFHGHVGALVQDNPPLGVLDTNDIMIHTYWAPPDEEAIRDTAYAQSKVRVLRWK